MLNIASKLSLAALLVGTINTAFAATTPAAAPAAATPAPATTAAPAAEDIAKYRHHIMETLGNMKTTIEFLLKGKVAANAGSIADQAKVMAMLTKNIPAMFPKGSTTHKSDAMPVIWEKWADFEKLAQDVATKADTLAKVAVAGNAADTEAKLKDLGAACKACHKDFRKDN
ncbi:MAG: cytochrome c [Thiotrichaceae bacterium]|nr:cytochrome c [Thiotrichaceae bacterium]